MKQIGIGAMQYTQEYDEKMPSGRMGAVAGDERNWQVLLQPYLKSYDLFRCPSNPRSSVAMNDGGASNPGGPNRTVVSYGAPVEISPNGAAFGGQEAAGPSLADFPSPSQTIMVCESNSAASNFRVTGTDFMDNGTANGYTGGSTALFAGHLGTMNVLFVDGHVKSMRPMATIPTDAANGMFGSGSINMWDRQGKNDYSGNAWGPRVNNIMLAATKKYQ